MASSKDEPKPRKIVDVAAPGKAAPPATSRPIIVTNRPMIKRDPMMTPTDTPTDMPEVNRPISRVAKPVKIIPRGAAEMAADEATPTPPDATMPEDAAPEPVKTEAKPSSKPITIKHVDQGVALEIGMEAVEGREESAETPAEAAPSEPKPEAETAVPFIPIVDSSSGEEMIADPNSPTRVKVSVPAPTKDDAVAIPVVTGNSKKGASDKGPEETPTKITVSMSKPDATAEPKQDAPLAPETPVTAGRPATSEAIEDATDATPAVPTASPTTEPGTGEESADDDDANEQLPASQALEDEQRKKDEAAAQVVAEQEKIIASKRYYLPIQPRDRRRGIVRAIVALVLVILLSLIWLDVVLDAGIVHIGGLHALTHFF